MNEPVEVSFIAFPIESAPKDRRIMGITMEVLMPTWFPIIWTSVHGYEQWKVDDDHEDEYAATIEPTHWAEIESMNVKV